MFDAKRIEIVIPEYCLPDLLECVERHGVDGYTLFRGLQSGDGISASSSNARSIASTAASCGASARSFAD